MSNSSSSHLVAELTRWIATAAPGARLPSTRSLVAQYGVSPVTVQKALKTLQTRGLVESRTGVGTFVRQIRVSNTIDHSWQTEALGTAPPIPRTSAALRTVSNDVITLHSGYPDRTLLPERLVRGAYSRASRSDAAVGRTPAAGLPELQAWFATELADATNARTAPPSAGDVIITPGSQSGLGSIFRALVGAGNPLIVESPTYWGAILAATKAGVQLVPVSSGPNGPDPDELARAFDRTRARAFYAQPNFANPTGAQWSSSTGNRVLDVVRDAGAFVIEDDWAHDFGISTESVPLFARDDSGHVVYVRSLTKSVAPSVRVAAIVARGPARERILADVQAESVYVSGILQTVALEVVTQPAWQTHLRAVRRELESRRNLLASELRELAPDMNVDGLPPGGLNLWGRLPDDIDAQAVARDCEAAGVLVAAGDEWFPAELTGQYLRLNFAGPNPAAFREAARVIGRVVSGG